MFYIYSRSQFERETMLSAEGLSLPFGELECYIWKDAVRASPFCSQVLGFSHPLAMADAVHGWPHVMALGMSILQAALGLLGWRFPLPELSSSSFS